MVREAVADVAQTAPLDVLLDGVEGLLLGDLHLGVGPAGDLDDHVQDAVVLVGEEGVIKFISVFAPTQLPLAVVEGLLTVVIVNFLREYSGDELRSLNFPLQTLTAEARS